jgi:ATP-binding cassette subfamily B protein
LPRHYTMGGRASSAPAPSALGGNPPPQQARTIRERFGALRILPPFLRLIWQTSPIMTAAMLVLRLVRALLPVATLYVASD